MSTQAPSLVIGQQKIKNYYSIRPLTREWDDEDAVEATRQEFSELANQAKGEEASPW